MRKTILMVMASLCLVIFNNLKRLQLKGASYAGYLRCCR